MPSPIAHIAVGVAIGVVAKRKVDRSHPEQSGSLFILFVALLGAVLPDFDAFVAIALGDFGKYHNNLTHSFLFAFVACVLLTGLLSFFSQLPKRTIFFVLAFACTIHLLMDTASVTRGVMLFWPFTNERFVSPIPLFYGVRWSEGVFVWHHVMTLLTETIFAAVCIWFSMKKFKH